MLLVKFKSVHTIATYSCIKCGPNVEKYVCADCTNCLCSDRSSWRHNIWHIWHYATAGHCFFTLCRMCTVQYAVYSVQCTVCSVNCTVQSLWRSREPSVLGAGEGTTLTTTQHSTAFWVDYVILIQISEKYKLRNIHMLQNRWQLLKTHLVNHILSGLHKMNIGLPNYTNFRTTVVLQ